MKKLYFFHFIVFIFLVFTSQQKLLAQNCWSVLGLGLGTDSDGVAAFTTYNNQLIAGGVFLSAGGVPVSNIAAWNGSAWSALGSGLNTVVTYHGARTSVSAMAVYNNELYVAGRFDSAGGVFARGIAKWNGTTWSALGSGVSGYVYDGPDSSRAIIYAMTVYNGELYVAGTFKGISGVVAQEIAKWNGTSWSAVAAGLATGESNSARTVGSLVVANNKLYAAGSFTNASGLTVKNIAAWDGNAWSSVGAGIGNDTINRGGVTALAAYQNNVVAAVLGSDGAGIPGYYISKWDGVNWSSVAGGPGTGVMFTGSIFSLLPLNGYLFAGGQFETISNLTNLNGVAKWDGSTWSGVGDTAGYSYKFALGDYQSHLFAGGNFTSIAGVSTQNVAEYSCTASGITENSVKASIQMFPNPFSNQLTFSLAHNEPTTVSLYNFLGQQILQQTFTNYTTINTAQFADGIYFYELKSEKGTLQTGKLVKQ